jgi:pimeloyl-ACP methyl ester carboxylesterase
VNGIRGRAAVSSALLALALSGCMSDGAEEQVPEGLSQFYEQSLEWGACEGRSEVECATLMVPVDYADPDGASLEVALIRTPATGEQSIGTLVLNPGGPGLSLVDSPFFPMVSPTVQQAYDVVGFDPRGVGRSQGLVCWDAQQRASYLAVDGTPDTTGEADLLQQGQVDYAKACEQAAGPLLPFLGTREVAQDLDILRAALDEDRLNYFGLSYGTHLGAQYAAAFPDRVGRMVLDSLVPTDVVPIRTWVHARAVNLETALDQMIAYCLAGGDCPLGDDPEQVRGRLAAFLDTIDQAPLDGAEAGLLTREAALGGLDSALASGPDGYGQAIRALDAAYRGTPLFLLDLAAPLEGMNPDTQHVVFCLDGGQPPLNVEEATELAQQWRAEAPIFGEAYAWAAAFSCAGWPAPTLDLSPRQIEGIGPILLVSSTGDPWTPPEDATLMADEIPDGVLLTYQGPEHFAYAWSSCVQDAADTYLLDGTLPDGLTCPDRTSG